MNESLNKRTISGHEGVQREVEKLYKDHFGNLVASLLRTSNDINTETAEDIIHDTFSSAISDWNKNGMPSSTTGWIYKVCRNKALNKIKKDRVASQHSNNPPIHSSEALFSESVLEDHQLKLLFACAHPDLSPKVQVVITLKYVANLRVEAIAKSLGMGIDALDKLLVRVRKQIKDERILLKEPLPSALKSRLPMVHKIIYLIFNEGYKSNWGTEIVRDELCEEALLLCKAILETKFADKNTDALYALMLFNSARLKSRFAVSGEILDLENQDRSLWNKPLLHLAIEYLMKSRTEEISEYHLEASIAYYHCTASTFKVTNWEAIANLYAKLQQIKPNPFVDLNYAIALYNSGEKEAGFSKLHALERHPFFNQYYLLNCSLGRLYQQEHNYNLAQQYYLKAIHQTHFDKERCFIQKQIDDIQSMKGE